MKPFVGLFVALGSWRRKGLPLLLDAVSELRQRRGLDVRLRVLGRPGTGDETLLRPVASLVESGVIEQAGYHEDVAPLFRSADALLVASYYESMSLVMLEALVFGKPIVTASVHGASETVEHGLNGYIVERTSADFARHIERLARDPDLCARMAAASLARSRRFAAHDLALRTESVYRAAAAT